MKLKELIIKKLLEFGKKHKLFVYPTLALVAIISAVSYAFVWSKGNSKKVVATILALVLLISQSYFMTSSASSDLVTTEEPPVIENVVENTDGNVGEPLVTGGDDVATTTEAIPDNNKGGDDELTPIVEAPQEQALGETKDFYLEFMYYYRDNVLRNSYAILMPVEEGSEINLADYNSATLNGLNTTYYDYEYWYDNTSCTGEKYTTYTVGEADSVTFYMKRSIKAYGVTLSDAYTAANPTGADINENVSVTGDTTTYEIDTKDFVREGYTFEGISGEHGLVPIDDNGIATITLSGDDYKKDYTVLWEGIHYTIRYGYKPADAILAGTSVDYTTDCVYGEANTLSNNVLNGAEAFTKRGYECNGWISTDKGTEYDLGQVVNDQLFKGENEEYILNPRWAYVSYDMTLSSAAYEYGTSKSYDIQAKYKSGDTLNTDFTYSISSEQSRALSEYGLSAVVRDGKVVLSGTPTKTGSLTLTISVTDNNATENKTSDKTVAITIAKKTIKVTGVEKNSKTYDGTTNIAVGNIYFEGAAPNDHLTITSTNQGGSFDSANAGTRQILLSGLKLGVTGSTNESVLSNYILATTASVPGSIDRRYVNLKTTVSYDNLIHDYILTGEGPDIATITITEEDTGRSDDGLLTTPSSQAQLMSMLGITGYSISENALTTPGDYEVGLEYDDSKSNYQINKIDKAKITVKQDSPDGLYSVSGEKGENGWYKTVELTPKADSYYNQIGRGDGNYQTVLSVSEDDYNATDENGKGIINVQLYNSLTGAYTSISKTDAIKVDSIPPIVDTYKVSTSSAGELDGTVGTRFPGVGSFLTHGNYLREEASVDIDFAEDTSGHIKLYYKYGENGNYNSVDTNEEGQGQFSIALGFSGKVFFYGVDEAGNESAVRTLIKGESDEWVLEDIGPALTVTLTNPNNDNSIVSNYSHAYYRKIKVNISARDTGSGIYGIKWEVDGVMDSQITPVDKDELKSTNATFDKIFDNDDNSEHHVKAYVYDNAENVSETDELVFYTDCTSPEINVTSGTDDDWVSSRTVEFTVDDSISGIRFLDVKDSTGKSIEFTKTAVDDDSHHYTCSVTFNTKGEYYIQSVDEAGNESEKVITYNKISNTVPGMPTVTVNPDTADGGDDWYVTYPTVTITAAEDVDNGTTEVITEYKVWKGDNEPKNATVVEASDDIVLDSDGIWHVKAYSKSVSGVEAEKEVTMDIKVDTSAPAVTIGESTKEDGIIHVNFTVEDTGSGIDSKDIWVTYGNGNTAVTLTETENGYTGSFNVEYAGNYTIHAKDKAGNATDDTSFTPITMRVKQVSNITATTANVGANIYRGTYNIKAYQIRYKEDGAKDYTLVTANAVTDEAGNVAVSYPFTNLKSNTKYIYSIVAISDIGENIEYVGAFRTNEAEPAGVYVTGKVRYNQNVAEDIKAKTITVSLYSGFACLGSMDKANGDSFTFENVSDGTYMVVASNGIYTKSMALVINDGYITYPESNMLLVLGGQNTTVEYGTSDTPPISVVGLDDIFEYDSTNYTKEDQELIDAGGTVEFKLVATLMRVTNVSDSDISAMYALEGSNAIVGAYIDLTVYKIRYDVDGTCLSKEQVSDIGGTSLKITVPLGDLAGKPNLRMIRIHNGVAAKLTDIDTQSATFTIDSSQYSTYALVYDSDKKDTISDDTTATTESSNTTVSTSTDSNQTTTSITSLRSSGTDTPKTGDNGPVGYMVILFAVSTMGIAFIRKIKNNQILH